MWCGGVVRWVILLRALWFGRRASLWCLMRKQDEKK